MLRTIAYIDGFNLYYGRLKSRDKDTNIQRRKYRWLDLDKLMREFLPKDAQLKQVNFYTAKVEPFKPGDNNETRQKEYWKALRTTKAVKIIEGKFFKSVVTMPEHPLTSPITYKQVLKTEEKRSDVNLASHLIADAYENNFDLALIVTNDSDLLEPIKIVNKIGRDFLILNPHTNTCHDFKTNFNYTRIKRLKESHIKKALFPIDVKNENGEVVATCPIKWQ